MAFDPAGLNILFDDDAFIITRARLNEAAPVIVKNVTSVQVVSDIDVEISISDEQAEHELEAALEHEIEIEEESLDEVDLGDRELDETEIDEEVDVEVEL